MENGLYVFIYHGIIQILNCRATNIYIKSVELIKLFQISVTVFWVSLNNYFTMDKGRE